MSNEKTMIGSALIKMLRDEQKKQDLTLNETAELLGMSKPYLTALYCGDRPMDRLDAKYLEAIAVFLNLPKAQIYNLAEILLPKDFVHRETIDKTLEGIHERLSKDVSWLHLCPTVEEWKEMPQKQKLLVAYMYEMIAHEKIIEGIKTYKFE